MTDDKLRAALEAAVAELDNIVEMVETGGDIPTEITIVQNRLRAALAASATDEGPNPAECAICGDYVAGGQPVHNICVAELTAKAEDRPVVPEALDAMTLGRAMDFVDREDEALGVVGRGRKVDRIIEAYAALRSKEPT